MSNPNETQVGGDHYKSEYQHWDLVLETGMSYLEGCATKYIARWRKKGGVADLEKAKHYIEKLQEDVRGKGLPSSSHFFFLNDQVNRFSKANELQPLEHGAIHVLVTWNDPRELNICLMNIDRLIEQNTFDTGEPGAGYVDQR